MTLAGAFKINGIPIIGDKMTTGDIFFVDSGTGSDSNDGRDEKHPFATLDNAIGQCTADTGNVIYLFPGHAETTTAEITADVAGVTIMGLGNGLNRPTFTGNHTGDLIAIDADDVHIENIVFAASTAANTAQIDINAAQATVKNCYFIQGASNAGSITITASGTNALITGCEWKISANGPDHAIKIEAIVAGVKIIDNILDGGTQVNGWDTGAIYCVSAATGLKILDNVVSFVTGNAGCIEVTAAATGVIGRNLLGDGALAQMLDPGSCMCFLNYEADAVDESGRLFPTAGAA